MIGEGASILVLACFVVGCGVRLWRWSHGEPGAHAKRASAADHVRLSVRRRALDVPVEGIEGAPSMADDPLLPS